MTKTVLPMQSSLLKASNQQIFAEAWVIVSFPADDTCSARDWDGKDYLRIIPRVVW